MNKRMNVFISSFIILNIAVLIAVICLITRQNGDQGQNQDSISSGDMKNNIDKAYGEHIASGHEKQEDTTYDVRATNISPQMANLLKPIAFFTGLNNTGLVKVLEDSPAKLNGEEWYVTQYLCMRKIGGKADCYSEKIWSDTGQLIPNLSCIYYGN